MGDAKVEVRRGLLLFIFYTTKVKAKVVRRNITLVIGAESMLVLSIPVQIFIHRLQTVIDVQFLEDRIVVLFDGAFRNT